MKKWLAFLAATMLLIGAVAMPASAADPTVNVYLDAPAQVKAGESVAVSLYVNGSTAVGGVQGTIVYQTSELTYSSVTLRDDVQALGNTADVTYNTEAGVGTITFVLVSKVLESETAPADAWLTVNFTLAANATAATVALQNVVVSDATGDNTLATATVTQDDVTVVSDADLTIQMEGATIKTDPEKMGIRFRSVKTANVPDDATIARAGVLMFPKALMYADQDLTLNTIGKGGTKPAVAEVESAEDLAKVAAGEYLYATLLDSTIKGRGNLEIVARSFIQLTNGSVLYYSHNTVNQTGVDSGESCKSVVDVARAIAKVQLTAGAEDTLNDLEKTTGEMSQDDLNTLLAFCVENIGLLPQQDPQ